MSYITSYEEIDIEQGRHQELARSILRTLRVRFGAEAADSVAPRLQPLPSLNRQRQNGDTPVSPAHKVPSD